MPYCRSDCDKVSSHSLSICRKSSQNASSKLALCPAMTLEQLKIEDFMAAPVSICDTNIIVIFTKIAARKSSPIKLGKKKFAD